MADTKEIINCPACGKEMKKVFIEGANINIDICTDGCGGMLFDNRELEKFDEKSENADKILDEVKGKNFEKTDDNARIICPVCNIPMVKMGASGNVQIDVCNVCGAKFLDNGELLKIRNDYLPKETPEIDAAMEILEKETSQEIYGKVSSFFRDNFERSKSSDSMVHFVSRYLSYKKSGL